jgi:hypothetical protein
MLNKAKVYYNYFKSIKTKKPILIIESDDWGGIRMPDLQTYDKLYKAGLKVSTNPFNQLDSLETPADLELLLKILKGIYKNFGKKVKITQNFIVGNPDFEKIYNDRYSNYYFETFRDTYKRLNNNNEDTWGKLNEGIQEGYFNPQFHGREHVNVGKWLEMLRAGFRDALYAFESKTFAADFTFNNKNMQLFRAYDYRNMSEMDFICESISEGLVIFKEKFGFESKTAIAPSAVWSKAIEDSYFQAGVETIQSFVIQKECGNNSLKNVFHYTGELNSNRQQYLVRNCIFEPITNLDFDWVRSCLKQVSVAFYFNKPAIISMHRVNFSGRIDEVKRNKSLALFEQLLILILNKWPDVEFETSDNFGNQIKAI